MQSHIEQKKDILTPLTTDEFQGIFKKYTEEKHNNTVILNSLSGREKTPAFIVLHFSEQFFSSEKAIRDFLEKQLPESLENLPVPVFPKRRDQIVRSLLVEGGSPKNMLGAAYAIMLQSGSNQNGADNSKQQLFKKTTATLCGPFSGNDNKFYEVNTANMSLPDGCTVYVITGQQVKNVLWEKNFTQFRNLQDNSSLKSMLPEDNIEEEEEEEEEEKEAPAQNPINSNSTPLLKNSLFPQPVQPTPISSGPPNKLQIPSKFSAFKSPSKNSQ